MRIGTPTVFRNLFEFASGEIKPARDKLQPERYVVTKEVERYLTILEHRGDLGKWILPRNKGHVWYLKKWELPDPSPEVQQRELSRRIPQKTDEEIRVALDVIPLRPIKPDHEMERMERKERGEKSPAKPLFDYATHLPVNILAVLELHGAPLHTSRIKDFVISCLSRQLDTEAREKPLTNLSSGHGFYYGPDDARDVSIFGHAPLNQEELYIEAEERALLGSEEERRERKLNAWMDHPQMNGRRKQILELIALVDPDCWRNQTALADRIGCSRNTLRMDLKFLGDLIGFPFLKDDQG